MSQGNRLAHHNGQWQTLVVITVFLLLAAELRGDFKIPPRPSDTAIWDDAKLLEPEHRQEVEEIQAQVLGEAHTPIMVVTIKQAKRYGAQRRRIEELAEAWFDAWELGGRTPNAGILLLVSSEDKRASIQLGADWSREWDSYCRRVVDKHVRPLLRKGEASGAIVEGTRALARMARLGPKGVVAWADFEIPPRPGETSLWDRAELLKPEDQQELEKTQARVLQETKSPIVVVTINRAEEYGARRDLTDLAAAWFHAWDLDAAAPHTGMLLLASYDDRRASVQLGADWAQGWSSHCRNHVERPIRSSFAEGECCAAILEGVEALARMAHLGPDGVVAWAEFTIPPRPADTSLWDKAELLHPKDQEEIEGIQAEVLREANSPIVVVTIDRMEEYGGRGNIEQFADAWFDAWEIGAAPDNTGILLLVSYGDRRARIDLGSAWGRYWDGYCRRVMDHRIIPSFKKEKHSKGILQGVASLAEMARRGPQGEVPAPGLVERLKTNTTLQVTLGFIGFVVLSVLSGGLTWGRRRYYGRWSDGYGGGGGSYGGGFGGGGGGGSGGGGASGGW